MILLRFLASGFLAIWPALAFAWTLAVLALASWAAVKAYRLVAGGR